MSQILQNLKNSDDTQKNEILSNLDDNYSSVSSEFEKSLENILSKKYKSKEQPILLSNDINSRNVIRVHAVNETVQNGELAVYGPSSIYIPGSKIPQKDENDITDYEKFHQKTYIKFIENFFIWIYPDITMFIHRESFLTDFYKSKDDIKVSVTYCGEELINALCCLGCFNTHDDELDLNVTETADHFYHLSRDLVFEKLRKDSYSSIVMIQTLLTLSIYDLGRGNNVSAWLLSGIAIRIGEHKGLSHEPLEWKSDFKNPVLSDYDIRVRSRVYWGCYLTEHFIANVLGRDSILNSKQTTIRDSDDLPRLQGIEQFCYKDPLDSNYNIRLDVSRHLLLLDNMYRICETYKPLIFSNSLDNFMNSLLHLKEFTNSILIWREQLPENLQWNNTILQNEGHNPVMMNIRNQYFLALLSFHRPFITESVGNLSLDFSAKICMEIISEIKLSISSFLKIQSIKKCSLVIVYNTILSIMITMMMMTKLNIEDNMSDKLDTLNFFVNILKDMSSSWGIAGKYYNSISNTYTNLVNELIQNKDKLVNSDSNYEKLVSQNLQLLESDRFSVHFENEIFSSEDIPNIFHSILDEMPNFYEGGFGLDFSTNI